MQPGITPTVSVVSQGRPKVCCFASQDRAATRGRFKQCYSQARGSRWRGCLASEARGCRRGGRPCGQEHQGRGWWPAGLVESPLLVPFANVMLPRFTLELASGVLSVDVSISLTLLELSALLALDPRDERMRVSRSTLGSLFCPLPTGDAAPRFVDWEFLVRRAKSVERGRDERARPAIVPVSCPAPYSLTATTLRHPPILHSPSPIVLSVVVDIR